MTDIDGTLTADNIANNIEPQVIETIKRLEKSGIIIGLVSGRTYIRVDTLAEELHINGPLIAENGALARLKPGADFLDFGFSRQPALKALEILKLKYPGKIKEREDNLERKIDAVFWSLGIPTTELAQHLTDAQLLDSGYILHVMQKGISKGETLAKLLNYLDDGNISTSEVMVMGDSITDRSLFELFEHSVLIPNPKVPEEDKPVLNALARYVSNKSCGEGFIEVAEHIIKARS